MELPIRGDTNVRNSRAREFNTSSVMDRLYGDPENAYRRSVSMVNRYDQ